MNCFINRIVVLSAIIFVGCGIENMHEGDGWYHRPYDSVSSYNVIYATVDGVDLTMDLFWFSTVGVTNPVIVFVHGPGDKEAAFEDDIKAMYFHELGYAVATLNYRSAYEDNKPLGTGDVRAAIQWLRSHTMSRQLKSDAIFVWGVQEGASIAAGSAYCDQEPPDRVGDDEDESGKANAVVLWNGDLAEVIGCVSSDDPPTLIQHDGPLPENSVNLDETLKESQVQSILESIETDLASFENLDRMEEFFGEHLPQE